MDKEMRYNTLEGILYQGFVKYDRLSRITFETFSETSIANATDLNIFIDLYSIMHAIFSEHNRTVIKDYTAITSCIINMCGHYRDFFKRLQVKTKFYLIFSFNTCDINRKFVAGYNETFNRKTTQIKEFIEVAANNFELLDLLCPYLPDIFFVKSARNYESSVIISHIIDTLHDGHPNLIISKDLYPIQLCSMHPYTSYLKPIKYMGEDNSIMIPICEKYSYRESFWKVVGGLRKIDYEKFMCISPVNFPLLMALHKFPERDINTITVNITEAIKIIYNIVESEDIKIIPSQLYSDDFSVRNIPVAKVESLCNVLDVSFMKQYYSMDPESKSIKFTNIRDDAALRNIDAKFFSNNPIDFSKL